MICAFMTKWGKDMPPHMAGKPTYFPEKIWSCFREKEICEELANFLHSKWSTNRSILDFKPKKHTIRVDAKDRWKAGMSIHFTINARSKNVLRFAPVEKVKSVQKIKIVHSGEKWRTPWVFIDGALMMQSEIETLAHNDGFDSVQDFFAYFNTDFLGKIIHWTDLKY